MEQKKTYLLREYYQVCIEGACKNVKLNEEELKLKQDGHIVMASLFQRGNAVNANGRLYKTQTLAKEFQNLDKIIKEKRLYAELDHSDSSIVELKNACARILRTWQEGDEFWGTFVILPNDKGQVLKSIVETNGIFGCSSRSLGTLHKENNVNVVGDDLQMLTIDMVSDPSTSGALSQLLEVNSSQIKQINENFGKSYRLNKLLNNILS